jgi:hypothetical protein
VPPVLTFNSLSHSSVLSYLTFLPSVFLSFFSIQEKPSFRRLVPSRRCLVLANGFYEWKKEGTSRKQPYYIFLAPDETKQDVEASPVKAAGEGPDVERRRRGKSSTGGTAWAKDMKPKQEDVVPFSESKVSPLEKASSFAERKIKVEEPMVFAGLYDIWSSPEGPMHTFTILTMDAAPRLEWLHNRQPAVLRTQEAQRLWLEGPLGCAVALNRAC